MNNILSNDKTIKNGFFQNLKNGERNEDVEKIPILNSF